jgi:hypothetical protein
MGTPNLPIFNVVHRYTSTKSTNLYSVHRPTTFFNCQRNYYITLTYFSQIVPESHVTDLDTSTREENFLLLGCRFFATAAIV